MINEMSNVCKVFKEHRSQNTVLRTVPVAQDFANFSKESNLLNKFRLLPSFQYEMPFDPASYFLKRVYFKNLTEKYPKN